MHMAVHDTSSTNQTHQPVYLFKILPGYAAGSFAVCCISIIILSTMYDCVVKAFQQHMPYICCHRKLQLGCCALQRITDHSAIDVRVQEFCVSSAGMPDRIVARMQTLQASKGIAPMPVANVTALEAERSIKQLKSHSCDAAEENLARIQSAIAELHLAASSHCQPANRNVSPDQAPPLW
jgi:hypothetical protein